MIIAIYTIFFLFSFPFIFTTNRLVGTAYGLLFLYSIFALVGYLYFPGQSEFLGAYFGDDVGYEAAYFITLSLGGFFAINMVLYRRSAANARFDHRMNVVFSGQNYSVIMMGLLIAVFTTGLAYNFSELSWFIAERESVPLALGAFLFLFKTSVGILIVLYVAIRGKITPHFRRLIVPALIYMVLFLIAAVKLGNRTDPAALVVGIIVFESMTRTITLRTVFLSATIIFLAIIGLSIVETFRYGDLQSQAPIADRIIRNDYFAPAHILFAAIAFGYVQPMEVIVSNFSNALIRFNYPYLQQPITDLFRPNVATRSAGYAFYVFSEGYVFMGFWGFLYNAIVPSLYLKLWNKIVCTNHPMVNNMINAILATMAINLVRGQTSYFIKYGYTFVLPVMLFAVALLGIRIRRRELSL